MVAGYLKALKQERPPRPVRPKLSTWKHDPMSLHYQSTILTGRSGLTSVCLGLALATVVFCSSCTEQHKPRRGQALT